jgi:DHA1 family bicyclomycin/chloramphenicol resistance-like MFS transporter
MQLTSRRFTLFLASIAAMTSLSIDMSLPTTPAIEREFSLVGGQGGLTMSLFLAGYAVTPLVGGPLADRFGRRPVLLVSLLLFAVSAFLCGLSTSFAMLLAFRLFQGCAAGVATTMPLAIVRDLLVGSAARKRISEVTTINSVMPILAPIVGTLIVRSGNWRVLFETQAIFGTALVLVLLFDFFETLPADRRRPQNPADLLHNYRYLLKERKFLGYALINGLTFACMFSFISLSPLILMQRMSVTRIEYPFLFAVIAAGTILGGLGSIVLNRRATPVRLIIMLGLVIMSTASLSGAVSQIAGYHHVSAILPAVFATLFGFGLISPSVTLEALAPVPSLAGSASGALRAILMLFGAGISGILATYCAHHPSSVEVITTLTMTGTAFTALLLYVALLRREPISQSQTCSVQS